MLCCYQCAHIQVHANMSFLRIKPCVSTWNTKQPQAYSKLKYWNENNCVCCFDYHIALNGHFYRHVWRCNSSFGTVKREAKISSTKELFLSFDNVEFHLLFYYLLEQWTLAYSVLVQVILKPVVLLLYFTILFRGSLWACWTVQVLGETSTQLYWQPLTDVKTGHFSLLLFFLQPHTRESSLLKTIWFFKKYSVRTLSKAFWIAKYNLLIDLQFSICSLTSSKNSYRNTRHDLLLQKLYWIFTVVCRQVSTSFPSMQINSVVLQVSFKPLRNY